jgi:hypothetical protein
MPYTATYLIQELARRMGELIISTPTAAGTTTTLIDSTLDQYLPEDIGRNLNCWVYGSKTTTGGMTPVDQNNRGLENRAKSWAQAAQTLTFYSAWPDSVTVGSYEIHTRTARSRKLEALNSAIRVLNLSWFRPFQDEVTVTTAANQWRYALPNSVNGWTGIVDVQVQMAPSLAGYPYQDASNWNVQPYRAVDASGNSTWYLQFGLMPPPGRIIRIRGTAGYPDLVNEADILAIPPELAEALDYVYQLAMSQLLLWESMRQPAGQVERLRQSWQDLAASAKAYMDQNGPTNRVGNLAVPGMGDGSYPGSAASDPSWLGALHSP